MNISRTENKKMNFYDKKQKTEQGILKLHAQGRSGGAGNQMVKFRSNQF